jgi:hypothetical protein
MPGLAVGAPGDSRLPMLGDDLDVEAREQLMPSIEVDLISR